MPLRDDEVVAWSARDGVDVEELLGEMQDHGMVRHRKVSALRVRGIRRATMIRPGRMFPCGVGPLTSFPLFV